MTTTRNTILASAAALALGLGLAACGEDAQDNIQAAGEDMQAAAEDVADAVDEAIDDMDAAMDDASMRTASPDGARVYFMNLEDGDVVSSPVPVQFGADGVGVTAAGDQTAGTGHHHLLIDTTVDDLDLDMPIPNDATHVHFGMGQTGTAVELSPGEHTLQLLMGDWTHIPHDPVLASDVITITVE